MELIRAIRRSARNHWWTLRRRLSDYHGQFNPPTDHVIARYFPRSYAGTCIEVGAADGVSCSNTLHFERKGWACLCIEANPVHEESLRRNRRHVEMCAVADQARPSAAFHVADMTSGEYEAVSALELDLRLVDAHRHLLTGIHEVRVEVKTLDQCLERFLAALPPERRSIDFMSVDTEGTELSVLQGLDLERWRIPLLVVENNFDDREVGDHLRTFGYLRRQRYQVNDFFTRADAAQVGR
jgi:FkbM family methyltransferase